MQTHHRRSHTRTRRSREEGARPLRADLGFAFGLLSTVLLLPSVVHAGEQVYQTLPLEDLSYAADEGVAGRRIDLWSVGARPLPFATLDGGGEVYLHLPGAESWELRSVDVGRLRLSVQAEAGREVDGVLFLPGADGKLTRHRFSVPLQGASAGGRLTFLESKHNHYMWRFRLGLPGAAWFRHQARLAEKELHVAGFDFAFNPQGRWGLGGRRPTELEDSYDLFTGGRALSENLQLERVLEPQEGQAPWVAIEDLEGITTRELDWKTLVEGLDPELDSLARLVPFDQHGVFFPSFGAMVRVVDEARENGAPVIELFEASSEDAGTRERYERQLCLSLDFSARLLGDRVVASVAVTGSDPYLRTGSDVALLFETRSLAPLAAQVRARQNAAVAKLGAVEVEGLIGGQPYFGVRNADRSVCSYTMVLGDTLIVSNSLAQLERVADVKTGRRRALADLDEYRFFRQRYARGGDGEACLMVLSDATIRRWCSPRWRIGAARRTRAAALMAEEQAHLIALRADGRPVERTLVTEHLAVPGGGALWRGPDGVRSEIFGSPAFLTPIVELEMEAVTVTEREAYERFRIRYQNNWRRFFDPIALRVEVRDEALGLDLTVMPLIEGTDYRELMELTGAVAFAADAGDPHSDAILHYVMSIDPGSRSMRQLGGFLGQIAPNLSNPLAWLGDSVAFYIDRDPVWEEMAQAERPERFLEDNLARLPIGAHVSSKNPLRLAAFMSGIRALVQTSAPGLVRWETRETDDGTYVCILAEPNGELGEDYADFGIYYATVSDGLMLSLREDVLLRALARRKARRAGEELAGSPPTPWQGQSVAVHADRDLVRLFEGWWGLERADELRNLSWSVLPILNEWKRLFPNEDPIAFHARHFGVRLLCPGDGEYAWNEAWRTMESSAYGHPGEPIDGPSLPPGLDAVTAADVGLTFEENGLRARARVSRQAK